MPNISKNYRSATVNPNFTGFFWGGGWGQYGPPNFLHGYILKHNSLKCMTATRPSIGSKIVNFRVLSPAACKVMLTQKPSGRSRVQK